MGTNTFALAIFAGNFGREEVRNGVWHPKTGSRWRFPWRSTDEASRMRAPWLSINIPLLFHVSEVVLRNRAASGCVTFASRGCTRLWLLGSACRTDARDGEPARLNRELIEPGIGAGVCLHLIGTGSHRFHRGPCAALHGNSYSGTVGASPGRLPIWSWLNSFRWDQEAESEGRVVDDERFLQH